MHDFWFKTNTALQQSISVQTPSLIKLHLPQNDKVKSHSANHFISQTYTLEQALRLRKGKEAAIQFKHCIIYQEIGHNLPSGKEK